MKIFRRIICFAHDDGEGYLFDGYVSIGDPIRKEGKKANKLKGRARDMEKPNIPTIGAISEPLTDTSTSSVPIIGPVQEKDTKTKVKAINSILTNPVVFSAFRSILVLHDEGRVISKTPKKDMAKTTKSTKKKRLKNALVERLFNALAPKSSVITMPNNK